MSLSLMGPEATAKLVVHDSLAGRNLTARDAEAAGLVDAVRAFLDTGEVSAAAEALAALMESRAADDPDLREAEPLRVRHASDGHERSLDPDGLAPTRVLLHHVLDLPEVVRVGLDRDDETGTEEGDQPDKVGLLAPAVADDHYERHDTFDEVYRAIAQDLVLAAAHHDRVLYAVPGSPLVLEYWAVLKSELSNSLQRRL